MKRYMLVLVGVSLSMAIASCGTSGGGGGGGGGGGAGKAALEKLRTWAADWSGDATAARRPQQLEIPVPPPVGLSAVRDTRSELRPPTATLADARSRVYDEAPETAAEFVKEAVCEWFGWYLGDPSTRTVPDSATFAQQFVSAVMKVPLNSPPNQQFAEASDLVRDSIIAGQQDGQTDRYVTMAAACSVPYP